MFCEERKFKQKIRHQLNKNKINSNNNKLLGECYDHGSFNYIANKTINSAFFKTKDRKVATGEIIL